MFFFKTSIVIETKGFWFTPTGMHTILKSSLHPLEPVESYWGALAQVYSAVTNTFPTYDPLKAYEDADVK